MPDDTSQVSESSKVKSKDRELEEPESQTDDEFCEIKDDHVPENLKDKLEDLIKKTDEVMSVLDDRLRSGDSSHFAMTSSKDKQKYKDLKAVIET